MSRVIAFSLLLVSSLQGFSTGYKTQAMDEVYFMMGLSFGVLNLEGLNQVIEEYNEARPWLDKEFKPFGTNGGLSFTAGVGARNVWIDAEWNFRRQVRKSEGTDPMNVSSRAGFRTTQYKLRNHSGTLSIGAYIPGTAGAFCIGYRGEIGTINLTERVYSPDETKGFYFSQQRNLMFNGGPHIKWLIGGGGNGVALGMYYLRALYANNWYKLSNTINNTQYREGQPQYETRTHIFGFSITFGIYDYS